MQLVEVMIDACRQAARTRDDLADIVNIALEELLTDAGGPGLFDILITERNT